MPARLLLFAVAAACASAPAQNEPSLQNAPLADRIDSLLRDPAVTRAHWGVAVTTLDGTPLYSLDQDKLFRPASTAKLFTTAAAMALLGPDTTVTTTVLGTGSLDSNGVLHGDLVLRGAGDANLSGRHLPYRSPAQPKARFATTPTADPPSNPLGILEDLTSQLAARGLKQVTGRVLGDDSLWPHEPYPIGWEVDDLVWGYAAPVSALALNDNEIVLTLKYLNPRSKFLASITPDAGYLSVPNQQIDVTAVSAEEPAVLGVDLDQLGQDMLKVQGQLHEGTTQTEEIAVLHPATFAASAFAHRLHARDIQTGPSAPCLGERLAPTQTFATQRKTPLDLRNPKKHAALTACAEGEPAQILASHISAPLHEDVTVTLKESLNLHAEMLLRRLGETFGDNASYAQGARVVHQWLAQAGIPDAGFLLYDGSGLSSHDLVSPRTEAQLLAYAATQPWFTQWKAALPIGGVDGTLAHRFTEPSLHGHVFAKTGTLGETRALAGYVQCATGRELIFSILVDNHDPTTTTDRVTMDKIVAAIATSN